MDIWKQILKETLSVYVHTDQVHNWGECNVSRSKLLSSVLCELYCWIDYIYLCVIWYVILFMCMFFLYLSLDYVSYCDILSFFKCFHLPPDWLLGKRQFDQWCEFIFLQAIKINSSGAVFWIVFRVYPGLVFFHCVNWNIPRRDIIFAHHDRVSVPLNAYKTS